MIWIYNALLTLFSPFWVPWMISRARKRGEAPNWKERGGDYPIEPVRGAERIWIHAVSVGEVVAVLPLLRGVRARLPEVEIVLSVTTSSGHQTARDRAEGLYDHLVYFPIDVPRFCMAALTRVRPRVVAVMETELWMNFLWSCQAMGARTILINGRISDRSYPRARRLRFFYRSLLRHLDRALMQTDRDADRIRDLGAAQVEVLGNCKFDQAVEGTDADPAHWRRELGISEGDAVVVIGSTRGEREEALVLEALRDPRLASARIVWAPRHLERAPELAAAVQQVLGACGRRSAGRYERVTLLDTYGELAPVYSVADVVVIGGGFDDLGGQNLIQPLAHGKPVVHGPHMQNFRDSAEMARHAGATVTATTPQELAEAVVGLLDDPGRRAAMGAAARALVQGNVGASDRYADALAEAYRAHQATDRGEERTVPHVK